MLCYIISQHKCVLWLNFLLGFRLYSQLEEVKRQKEFRSRQESYAKNREKARDFQRVRHVTRTHIHNTSWWSWSGHINNENMFHTEILKEKRVTVTLPQVKKSSWWEFCRLRHVFPQIWYMNLQLKQSYLLLLKADMSDLGFTETSHLPRIHLNIRHYSSVLYRCGHDEICDAHLSFTEDAGETEGQTKAMMMWCLLLLFVDEILKCQALLFVCLYVVYFK